MLVAYTVRMSEESTSVPVDTQLEAVAHADRRRLLLALLDERADGELPLDVEEVDFGTGREELWISMYHSHLPKLEHHGFVEVTSDHRTVTTGPRFGDIEPLLELLEANRNRFAGDWA